MTIRPKSDVSPSRVSPHLLGLMDILEQAGYSVYHCNGTWTPCSDSVVVSVDEGNDHNVCSQIVEQLGVAKTIVFYSYMEYVYGGRLMYKFYIKTSASGGDDTKLEYTEEERENIEEIGGSVLLAR